MNKLLAPSTLKPKIQIKLPADLFNIIFHRLCRLELTVLTKKETTQKKSRNRAVNKIVSLDHKAQQQRPLPKHMHLLGHSRFYGVMGRNLDGESKDSILKFVELLLKTFCSVM